MNRILLSLAVAGLASSGLTAEAQGFQSVIVTKKDESRLAIHGSRGMLARPDADNICFLRPDGAYINIPLADVASWEYSPLGGDAIWTSGSAVVGDSGVAVRYVGTLVEIEGLRDGTEVKLAALDGTVLRSSVARGAVSVSLDGLPGGVYLLVFDNQSMKICRK